jgi:hypothetical protein
MNGDIITRQELGEGPRRSFGGGSANKGSAGSRLGGIWFNASSPQHPAQDRTY